MKTHARLITLGVAIIVLLIAAAATAGPDGKPSWLGYLLLGVLAVIGNRAFLN